jgi:ABC-type Fe3+/spermidine/putrescine transport system ATPase subunit
MTLALTGLTHRRPGAAPLPDGLSLTVDGGTLTALLGPSGCGKTTTLRLIAGLLAPAAGDIRIDGQPVLRLPPERRGAVLAFQQGLLFPHMTVAENVGFGLRMRGLPRADTAARTAEMLAMVGLPGAGPRRPDQLSGGQQQRVALARALVTRPRVLLLDEPLSNLDLSLRDDMRALIGDMQARLGTTTLMVTHDREDAVTLAARVALMLDGRIAQEGPPQDLFRRPASRAVAAFFGGRTFIPGRVAAGVFTGPFGPLRLPPGLPDGLADGPGLLTFRPEAVRLGPGPNAVSATLTARAFRGTATRLDLAAGGVAFEAALPPDTVAHLAPGDRVDLHLPPESLWVLPP